VLKRSDSRGLSTVIATLLVIVLVFVAIAILWVVLRRVIMNQTEVVEVQKEFYSESIQIAKIRVNNGSVNISLERAGGKIKVTGNETGIETVEVAEADIISVVDLSQSMAPTCNGVSYACCTNTLSGSYSSGNCSNVNPIRNITCTTTCGGIWVDKLFALKSSNKELINILSQSEGSKIGLVGYNTSIVNSASLDLTNDVNQLNNRIDSWQSGGSTCICCGINEALRKLQEQSSDGVAKKIIVMSDGEANVKCATQNTNDAIKDSIKSSCDAKASLDNLVIYTIGVGGNVNEDALRNISACGGGKYFSAMNTSELIDVYRSVAADIQSSKSVSKFNYLYIVFYNKTTSYKEKILEIPEILGVKSYNFDLTGNLAGNITKIEIYPVILSKSGKEIIGPLFDKWELK
jgi:hypothetical protein